MSGIASEHLHSDLAADGVTYDGDLCASWHESLQEVTFVLYLSLEVMCLS